MSKWGVFETTRALHVMPCNAKHRAIGGHAVSDQCWCRPQILKEGYKIPIIVHRDPQRGGTDA